MQAVSIQLPSGEGGWHATTLLDYTEDRELVVGRPGDLDPEAPVEPGTPVTVELPLQDGLRRFTVQVRGVLEAPPSLRLSWPEDGERIQRRDNVRVPVQLRTEVRVVQPGGGVGPVLVGQTSDLSVGGVRVDLVDPLEPDSEIELTLHVPSVGKQECRARVLRTGELARPAGRNRHWVAVSFTFVAPAVQREITKLVFDIQRDLLRRG